MGFANQFGDSTGAGPHSARSPVLVVPPTPLDNHPQLQDWLEQFVAGDFQFRWDISKTLKQYPLDVLEPLLALLPQVGEDEELLWFIARLLGEIDHPTAVVTLADMLRSADTSEMQSVAVLALANRGKAALPALGQLLLQPKTRLLAVEVLSQIDESGVVPLLLTVIQDEDAAVRAAAIESLGGFADPVIAPALLAALQDHDSGVRRLAVRAVGARAAHLPGVALDEAIAPLLQDLNPQVVEQAITALGRLDTEVARQGLGTLLSEEYFPLSLQLKAVRALGWSQAPGAMEQLIAQLERSLAEAAQPNASAAALPLALEIIVVLGRLRSPQALVNQAAQALELRLPLIFAQTHGALKRSTALALGQLGLVSSFDALCAYLQDPAPGLSLHIVAALRRLDPVGGLDRLRGLAAVQSGGAEEAVQKAIAEWS